MKSTQKQLITTALITAFASILMIQPSAASDLKTFELMNSLISSKQGSINDIEFGQMLMGTLGDSDDFVLENGDHFDAYSITRPQSNKCYQIKVNSTAFAAFSSLLHLDKKKFLQTALVYEPLQQVWYAGILSDSGRHVITVKATDGNSGNYTVELIDCS